jgi:PST family polysaccharide transporter
MKLRSKSIRGLFWSAAQSWGTQAIALLVFAILARLLEPSAFGLLAMANVFVAFTKIFLDQGFSMAIIQRRDIEPAHLSTAFWSNMVVGALLAGLGIVAAPAVASVFGEPELTDIVRWLCIIFVVSSLSAVQQALLRKHFEFRSLAVRSLAAVVVGGAVGVAMAATGWGVWSLVGQQLANAVVQVVLLWKISDWRPSFEFSSTHFQDLFAYGANIVGINLAEFFSRNADKFLIGYYLGAVALGYYAIAYKLLETLARLFSSVTSQVIFSSFSALQEQVDRLRNAFYTATQLTGLVTFPLYTGLAVTAPYVVILVFGDQWNASVPVIQVLAFAGLLESVYLHNANVMLAMGKPSWRLKLNLLNAAANVVAFMIAVRWGIVAVAAAYVIRAYLLAPIPLVLVRRLIGIDIGRYLTNFLVPVSATAVMALVVAFAGPAFNQYLSLFWTTALSVCVGGVTYLAATMLLAPALVDKVRNVIRERPGAATS